MDQHHQLALDAAVTWIKETFSPIGIIASGSIIRGKPDLNSDFDIYVIHEAPFKQRVQKYFNKVPCEIFINNLQHVHGYFDEELKRNRPVTAHLLATGKILMGQDREEIQRLIEIANKYLIQWPPFDNEKKTIAKYHIATAFEDAGDLLASDPTACAYILNSIINDTVNYIFLEEGIALPRLKERITWLRLNRPSLGELLANYYQAEKISEKYEIAKNLISQTTGETGFFEWSSIPE